MVITEKILRNIVRRILSETLDKSYKYPLNKEITGRIPDWEYDSRDDDTDERNRELLSKRLGGRDMSNVTYSNGEKSTSINSVLKNMGFIFLHPKNFISTVTGIPTKDDIKYLLIEKDRFNVIKNQFQSALNFFNYKVVKMRDYDGSGFGYNIDGVEITIEPVFNDEVHMNYNGIYYHATPDRNVSKILKQGLVPKDRGQLGVKRPERIYLSPKFDSYLINRFEEDNGMEYTVLTVDLNGMNIKLYNDPYYDKDAVYTVSYIPPSRISVMNPQPHKLERERKDNISKWLEELCNGLGLTFSSEDNTIMGNYNGMEMNLQVCILPIYAHYTMSIKGNIQYPDSNGKFINRKWETYNNRSTFRYEEIKPLLIDKYLKEILTTGYMTDIYGYRC